MDRRQMVRMAGLLAVALGTLALPGRAGASEVKHSGTILAINKAAGTIVLGEMGPWRGTEGVTEITRRTILVTSATAFARVERAPGPPATRGIGEFVEAPLGPWEVKEGDFVTVQVQREGERLTAAKVTVVAPSGP